MWEGALIGDLLNNNDIIPMGVTLAGQSPPFPLFFARLGRPILALLERSCQYLGGKKALPAKIVGRVNNRHADIAAI